MSAVWGLNHFVTIVFDGVVLESDLAMVSMPERKPPKAEVITSLMASCWLTHPFDEAYCSTPVIRFTRKAIPFSVP